MDKKLHPSIVLSGDGAKAARWVPFAKQKARLLKRNQSKVIKASSDTTIRLSHIGKQSRVHIDSAFIPYFYTTRLFSGVIEIYASESVDRPFRKIKTIKSPNSRDYVGLDPSILGFNGRATVFAEDLEEHHDSPPYFRYHTTLNTFYSTKKSLVEAKPVYQFDTGLNVGSENYFAFKTFDKVPPLCRIQPIPDVFPQAYEVYRSDDWGETWQLVALPNQANKIYSLGPSFGTTPGGIVNAPMNAVDTTTDITDFYLLQSTDFGKTWAFYQQSFVTENKITGLIMVNLNDETNMVFTEDYQGNFYAIPSANGLTLDSGGVQFANVTHLVAFDRYGYSGAVFMGSHSDKNLYLYIKPDSNSGWQINQNLTAYFQRPIGSIFNATRYSPGKPQVLGISVFDVGIGIRLYVSYDAGISWEPKAVVYATNAMTGFSSNGTQLDSFYLFELVGNITKPETFLW